MWYHRPSPSQDVPLVQLWHIPLWKDLLSKDKMCCRLIHQLCCKRWPVASGQPFVWCCKTPWPCPSNPSSLWWHGGQGSWFLILSCADFSIFVQTAHEYISPLFRATRPVCEGKHGRLRDPVLCTLEVFIPPSWLKVFIYFLSPAECPISMSGVYPLEQKRFPSKRHKACILTVY